MIKISRINYNEKIKFVKLESRYLRILNGSNLENLFESEFLLIYDFRKILAPVKPSKVIVIDKNLKFKYIRANNSVISPSASVLSLSENLFLGPQIGIVIGKNRIFGFLAILSFFSNYFNDVRDYAVDTYSPFSEFILDEPFSQIEISVNERVFQLSIPPFDYEKIFLETRKFFHKLFIGDVIAYEFSDITFEVKLGDKIKLDGECGRIETEIKFLQHC